jgi:hypothetical protein
MLQDKYFADLVYNRYFEMRNNILSKTAIEYTIDSVANLLNEAQARHFQKWNILGINTGTPESGIQPSTYKGVIDQFKEWISKRLTWLDNNMTRSAFDYGKNSDNKVWYRVYPNPVGNTLHIDSDNEINNIIIFNIAGSPVKLQNGICDFSVSLDVTGLNPGIYFVRIIMSNGETETTRVVKI